MGICLWVSVCLFVCLSVSVWQHSYGYLLLLLRVVVVVLLLLLDLFVIFISKNALARSIKTSAPTTVQVGS